MSKNLNLLSARNAILAAAAVLLLSVLGMCVSMLRPHDSSGLARDSFGTRGGGYRGLYELLEEIGVPVRRDLAPPRPEAGAQFTLVMLGPNPQLVAVGPKYLHALQTWIKRGGRVVVAPSTSHENTPPPAGKMDSIKEIDVLQALDVGDVVTVGEMSEDYVEQDYTSKKGRRGKSSQSDTAPDTSWGQQWGSLWQPKMAPKDVAVTLDGSMAPLAADIERLAVPGEGFRTLRAEPDKLAGSLRAVAKDGKEHLLVAIVRHGAGKIVVLAEPDMLSNRLIANSDNSVLAMHLMAPEGKPVVFDEFYHGLAVRGNPLYLLTRPAFAAAFVGILSLVGVMAWRSAVFLGPPLNDPQRTRRDIGEYVSAMAQFFCRGRGSRRFLVNEVRDGVLRQICHELKLPMDTLDVNKIASALERRDRQRARQLESVVREVDATLAASADFPRPNFLPVMQRLANCL